MLYLRLWRLLRWLTFWDFRRSFLWLVPCCSKNSIREKDYPLHGLSGRQTLVPHNRSLDKSALELKRRILFRSKREGICWFATLTFKSENDRVVLPFKWNIFGRFLLPSTAALSSYFISFFYILFFCSFSLACAVNSEVIGFKVPKQC